MEGWVRNPLQGPICPANAASGISFQLFDVDPLHHHYNNKKSLNNPAWVYREIRDESLGYLLLHTGSSVVLLPGLSSENPVSWLCVS